jgi:hypothetical protein
MTFLSHGYAGAVAYVGICQLAGIDGTWIAPAAGAVLGSAPDTFDWVLSKLGITERWKLYVWWHHSTAALILSLILVAPAIHILIDRLIHSPVIPRPEEAARWPEERIIVLEYVFFRWAFYINMKRRDVLWTTGEIMLISLATNILQVIL